ncbi:hypothetical protein ABZ912_42465 [Nonomuraea angiospora]|uniref:zinc finger domain-containing protein n=1 Tax=Nonomuraea angiospora TaxID=46172 RepID=UPI003401FA09
MAATPEDEPVYIVGELTVVDQAWAYFALADECIGERTCDICGATPGQPCRPEPHRALMASAVRRAA